MPHWPTRSAVPSCRRRRGSPGGRGMATWNSMTPSARKHSRTRLADAYALSPSRRAISKWYYTSVVVIADHGHAPRDGHETARARPTQRVPFPFHCRRARGLRAYGTHPHDGTTAKSRNSVKTVPMYALAFQRSCSVSGWGPKTRESYPHLSGVDA